MVSPVRRATTSDLDVIRALCAEMDAIHVAALPDRFRESNGAMRPLEFWQAALEEKRTALLVSESASGQVVGYALLTVHDTPNLPNIVPCRLAILEDIAVNDAHRRAGHATRLIERAEHEARQLGATSIELRVWQFNAGARSLYEQCGYTDLQRRLSKPL